ncbi:MBL fold metallo-hydrolase [Rhodococcus sp. (in: high G+C Gram-positive bacteria)]|uniref:MBL fold metallo-hydrolase n=1 Tax=Rhodococcus sp. TaxID=1831 RepID=UPI00257E49FF|nr:MBL fold metallo-hydrolase [Rhodococcus sp. (in: high G+C Gram-positive bacteria)]MBQ9056445.1 MBL fold metallo-hydrolase [Rhodococcus sp. (in: high G+C Gram-positive bacteria)]
MTDLTLDVYTSPMLELPNGGMFSPTTSTLVLGETEVVLVDTPYLAEHIEQVIQRIEASGRRLTTVFITHGHSDHYFGLERLLAHFPQASAVSVASVAAHVESNLEADRGFTRDFFAGAAVDNTVGPTALDGDVLLVDGVELRIIEIEQADIAPAAIVHIPSIDAVIAGDAVYNGINPFLAVSGPAEWKKWIESVDRVAALNPRIVVAGHKQPWLPDDDLAASVDATRDYLQAFISGVDHCANSRELVALMQNRFPEHGNPSALILSAVNAFKRKKAAMSASEG